MLKSNNFWTSTQFIGRLKSNIMLKLSNGMTDPMFNTTFISFNVL